MKIEVRLKAGFGKAVYFADLTLDDKIFILGCPIWNGKPGRYKLSMPSRKGDKGFFETVRLAPSVEAAAQEAVEAAISSARIEGSQAPR